MSFIGFMLIENVFTIHPDTISGNGNLGIVIMLVFAPIFIISFILTVRRIAELFLNIKNKKGNIAVLTMVFVLVGILIYFELMYKNNLIEALGGGPGKENSRIYRFGWFNQYTNGLFFNTYTFMLTYLFAFLVGVIMSYRKR